MRLFITVLSVIALAAHIFATPTPLRAVVKFDGETNDRHIVQLKDGASTDDVINSLSSNNNVTHHWRQFGGFAAVLDADAINTLRASPDVDHIAEDGIMYTMTTQNDAPWGIARMSSTTKLSNQDADSVSFSYTYDASAGSGVDIYIVDTGVNTEHVQFGGRARWGATFGEGYADADGSGHGTHCAGIAAASQFGVAKAANIIAVKVAGDKGAAKISDIISGLNYVVDQARTSGRPSIVSMSIGGSGSPSMDNAVASTVGTGVHVVVAAGNNNLDAINNSPARVSSAVTVGATTIDDARVSSSNFGPSVDVYAPGQDITSTWIGSTTASMVSSGTSMAAPHVAGLLAHLISTTGNRSPTDLSARLKSLSLKDAISGLPSGTANNLAHL